MADKTISFADAARSRRQHYPAAGASDADIVDAVHRIDTLTQLYLSTIRETVLPLNEQLPITGPVADYEHFAQVLQAWSANRPWHGGRYHPNHALAPNHIRSQHQIICPHYLISAIR